MPFTTIPHDLSSLGDDLRYRYEQGSRQPLTVRVVDCAADAELAELHFYPCLSAAIDPSAALRRRILFTPAAGGTGFRTDAGRTVTAVVEAGGERSEPRTFLPALGTLPPRPCLLTSMPRLRRIPAGAADELTLFAEGACSVQITAMTGGVPSVRSCTADAAGLLLFRLDLADFPGAERICLDFRAGDLALPRIDYEVTPAIGGVRLAWRSSAGSLEHYTFPSLRGRSCLPQQERIRLADGCETLSATCECRDTLRSDYEPAAVLGALAELALSPQVFRAGSDGYVPVSVAAADTLELSRHGAPCCLEITLSHPFRTFLP